MSAQSPADHAADPALNGTADSPPPDAAAAPVGAEAAPAQPGPVAAFRDRFESLLPEIQRQWPEVARHTLEATRGSLDEVAHVISAQSGRTVSVVREQLQELTHLAGDRSHRLNESLQPLEQQLESLLDELNATLRPRIEKPVRDRPLLAIGVATGVGVLLGLLLASGRRSA
jgi:ElaB/YqjD/DUF883 family membrane-anchored ribosome-binding protein